jgi:hypothetical protein
VGSLIEELKTEYGTLATSSGQSGGSREKSFIRRAESKQKEVAPLQEEAQKLIQERAQLLNFSAEELDPGTQQVRRLSHSGTQGKKTLEREVASVASDNRIHHESRMKTLNQRV